MKKKYITILFLIIVFFNITGCNENKVITKKRTYEPISVDKNSEFKSVLTKYKDDYVSKVELEPIEVDNNEKIFLINSYNINGEIVWSLNFEVSTYSSASNAFFFKQTDNYFFYYTNKLICRYRQTGQIVWTNSYINLSSYWDIINYDNILILNNFDNYNANLYLISNIDGKLIKKFDKLIDNIEGIGDRNTSVAFHLPQVLINTNKIKIRYSIMDYESSNYSGVAGYLLIDINTYDIQDIKD